MSLLLLFAPSSGGLTVNATVGDAVANGSTASIIVSVQAGVGNAVANGSTASIYQGQTVQATIGNAVANGSTANVYADLTITATVGNAVANGSTASILTGVTVACTVGNAVANGSLAIILRAIFPDETDVVLGVTYGPTGVEYTGSFVGISTDLKLDLITGRMVKVLSDKVVMSL
jgi:hypothetical protein